MVISHRLSLDARMAKIDRSEFSDAAIGRRLEVTRSVFGLQQNEFCDRAGIAPTTYNQYERGKKRPSIESAIALCETYHLTLDWIYRGDPSGLRYDTAEAVKAIRQARRH
jgi:transcriptional regulator with XRE-family HTH domain